MSEPPITENMSGRKRSTVRQYLSIPPWVGLHVPLFLLVTLLMLPVILAIVMSTQSAVEVYQVLNLMPGSEASSNYATVLTEYGFLNFILNTLAMTTIIVVGKVTLSLLAALALVYYDFPYKNVVFFLILLTLLLPVPVRVIPLYDLVTDLGWGNSLLGLSGPYVALAT